MTAATRLTAVSAQLTARGELGVFDPWGDPIVATSVEWRASTGARGVVVSVTAYSDTHQNCTWMDPRFYVADGLNAEPPPAWVPAAPSWFWAAVDELQLGAES